MSTPNRSKMLQALHSITNYQISLERFSEIVQVIQEFNPTISAELIAEFLNGGENGWEDVGQEAAQAYYDTESIQEIADWAICGIDGWMAQREFEAEQLP